MKVKKTLAFAECEAKEFRSVAFSGDGRFILALGGPPDWCLVYWAWEKAKVVASYKDGQLRVLQNYLSKRQGQSFTSHAWLSDDSLVVASHNDEVHRQRTLSGQSPLAAAITSLAVAAASASATAPAAAVAAATAVAAAAASLSAAAAAAAAVAAAASALAVAAAAPASVAAAAGAAAHLLCDLTLLDGTGDLVASLSCSPGVADVLRCVVPTSNGFICGGAGASIRVFEKSQDPKEMYELTTDVTIDNKDADPQTPAAPALSFLHTSFHIGPILGGWCYKNLREFPGVVDHFPCFLFCSCFCCFCRLLLLSSQQQPAAAAAQQQKYQQQKEQQQKQQQQQRIT
ncbi:hypothetical protein ACSSS7_007323 [Eimeria intestinalis]